MWTTWLWGNQVSNIYLWHLLLLILGCIFNHKCESMARPMSLYLFGSQYNAPCLWLHVCCLPNKMVLPVTYTNSRSCIGQGNPDCFAHDPTNFPQINLTCQILETQTLSQWLYCTRIFVNITNTLHYHLTLNLYIHIADLTKYWTSFLFPFDTISSSPSQEEFSPKWDGCCVN